MAADRQPAQPSSSIFRCKPITTEEDTSSGLQRSIGLIQLTAIGIVRSSVPASSRWPVLSRTVSPGRP